MDDRTYRHRGQLALALIVVQAAPACWAQEDGTRHVTVQVGERLTRDDNVYRLPADLDPSLFLGDDARRDDVINSASLAVAGRWRQGEQGLAFDADLASNRFADNEHLDNVSGRGALEWNWRFGGRWSGRFAAQREQSLAGFANTASLERDLLDTRAYVGDVTLQVGPRWAALLRTRAATTGHDNELRRRDDSEQRSAAVGLAYRSPRDSTLEWELREVRATFPEQAVLGNAVSDYEERAARLELGYALTDKVHLETRAGYVRRTYAWAEDGNFADGIWGIRLEWAPTPSTQLVAERFRDVRAHLEAETNHFVSTGESLSATWLPVAELALTLRAAREEQRYIGAAVLDPTARRDAPTTASFAVAYQPRERVFLEAAVREERRESSNARFDYDAPTVSVAGEVRF